MAKDYDLEFVRASKGEGLRNSKVADNNPNPIVITRELIQNALDARVDDKTEVSFDLETIPVDELPGIEKYRDAFAAIPKKPHDKTIANIMKNHLKSKEIQVLWIEDKGKGLDSRNMNKLLDDGNSDKSTGLGSYGVGHLAAFLASGLRYIVYGGSSKEGTILSGHCILATFGPGTDASGPDGYVVSKTKQPDIFDRKFPKFADLNTGLWKNRLARIKREGTGSFVCILGFNHFLDEEPNDLKTEKEIAYAAACHFMPAIFEGKMKVRVGKTQLTKHSLDEIIGEKKTMMRRAENNEYGVAGARFYSLYECMRKENFIEVRLDEHERAKVFLDRTPSHEKPVIHLYRQGMWITSRVPGLLSTDFSDYKAFTAIVLVDQEEAPELNRIVTSAEGPKHVEVDMKRLDKYDRAIMKEYFGKIKEELEDHVEENKGEDELDQTLSYTTTGFRRTQPGFYDRLPDGKRTPDSDPDPDPDPNPDPEPPPGPKPQPKRKGKHLDIPHICVAENEKIQVVGGVDQDYGQVEVNLISRSGSDQSCDNPVTDALVLLKPQSEKDGKAIPENFHIPLEDDEEKYSAVKLGKIKKGDLAITLFPADPPPLRGGYSL